MSSSFGGAAGRRDCATKATKALMGRLPAPLTFSQYPTQAIQDGAGRIAESQILGLGTPENYRRSERKFSGSSKTPPSPKTASRPRSSGEERDEPATPPARKVVTPNPQMRRFR